MIEFEKIKKHLENTLTIMIEGESLFTIKPPMSARHQFLSIVKCKDEAVAQERFIKFMIDMVKQASPEDFSGTKAKDNEEHLYTFIQNYYDDIYMQVGFAFKVFNKAEIEEKAKQLQEKLENKIIEKKIQ